MSKIKLACISFMEEFGSTLEQNLKAVSEIGAEYVELANTIDGACMLINYGFCPSCSYDMDPRELRKKAADYGLTWSAVAAHGHLLHPQGGWIYGVPQIKKAIKFADGLGASIVITSEGHKPHDLPEKDVWKVLKSNLDAIMPMAERYEMYIAMEPHGPYSTNAEGLQKMMEMCPSERLAVNFDTGNVFIAGNDPVSTIEAVADKVVYCHMKDVSKDMLPMRGKVTGIMAGPPLGEGIVDFEGIISVLKRAGFDGFLSVEAMEGKAGSKKSLEYLQSLVEA